MANVRLLLLAKSTSHITTKKKRNRSVGSWVKRTAKRGIWEISVFSWWLWGVFITIKSLQQAIFSQKLID